MSEHKPLQAPGAQPEVRVAIVGVGNCASSLVQGVQYYYDADVPPTNVTVQRGPTLDGIGKYYADTIEVSDAEAVDVVKVLRDAEVDVLVSYLPVGAEE